MVDQIFVRYWVKMFPQVVVSSRGEFDTFWNTPYSELPEHRQLLAAHYVFLLAFQAEVTVGSCDGTEDFNASFDVNVREMAYANRRRLEVDNASLAQIFS